MITVGILISYVIALIILKLLPNSARSSRSGRGPSA
jgi:hypothetical protein